MEVNSTQNLLLDYNPPLPSLTAKAKAVSFLAEENLQHNGNDQKEPTDATGSRRERVKWSLTQQAFDKLLACFSPDRDEAARQYEFTRVKLLRFFEWRGICSPDKRVDETLDRVARRIDEGQQIDNLPPYIYKVAYLVFLEALKEPKHTADLETDPPSTNALVFEEGEQERRRRCFDRCLEELAADSRKLILDYYQEERRAKIELRKLLADRLGVPLNALRIRAHRIRARLEQCIEKCISKFDTQPA